MMVAIVSILALASCSFGGSDTFAIMEEVHSTIRYARDEPGEGWKLPWDTRSSGYGDCEDFCILFMDELIKLGIEAVMIIIPTPGGGHAMVESDGVIYDVTGGDIVSEKVEIIFRYSYDESMKIAWHDTLVGWNKKGE